MIIIMWNCQGASQPKFLAVLKAMIHDHKPDILTIVEPRISGSKADKIIRKLNFPFSHRVEASGFSGGIWLLWTHHVQVSILKNHWQFIHARIHVIREGRDFFLTSVYASPSRSIRSVLWSELFQLAQGISKPWAVMGDFNVVLTTSERRTSTGILRCGCPAFEQFVDSCSLIDLGFSGPKFTWRRGLSFARLDRCLVNSH